MNEFCRFCLKNNGKLQEIEPNFVEKCGSLFGISLKHLECPKTCKKCLSFIEKVEAFKLRVVQSDVKLRKFRLITGVEDVQQPESIFLPPVEAEDTAKTEKNQVAIKNKRLRKPSEVGQKLVQCKICHYVTKALYLSSHMRKHKNGPCKVCGKESALMELHVLINHRDAKTYTPAEKMKYWKYYCTICNIFTVVLRSHNEINHVQDVEHVPRKTCEHCGFTATAQKFKRHKGFCANTPPFECAFCGSTARTRTDIKNHIQKIHLKIRKETCDICNAKVYDKNYLRMHKRRYHQEPTHLCGYCGKGFWNKLNLKYHIEAIHIQNSFVCKVCGATCNTKGSLLFHMQSSHDPKALDQEYSCVCICGLSCFSRKSFVQHLSAEHCDADGRYICCNRTFRLDHFKRHIEKIHKIECIKHIVPKDK